MVFSSLRLLQCSDGNRRPQRLPAAACLNACQYISSEAMSPGECPMRMSEVPVCSRMRRCPSWDQEEGAC